MNGLELLRFAWTQNQLKLLLVAMADGGPCARAVWVARSGVPRNHLAAVLAECERLGGCKAEAGPEGLAIRVQPVEFWRVTPLLEVGEWVLAWRGVVQARLHLQTEMPSLAETMAVCADVPGIRAVRVASCPDSGHAVKRLNGSDLLTFNVERLKGCPASGQERNGWIEPETEEEAMAACARMFGGEEEMRLWGGRWRNRWRAKPDGLRKVLNMVREDRAVGRTPMKGSNWGRYANDLWKRFVDRAEVAS